ncbi:uncharacterized protein LOC116411112 [Xenopus tropicalis]|uniref:Uncharacterized LOC116411112 n=1 Tax=Xenopus tropicalis TaxID=8364 RepID=A0A803J561_XENTR|nr:uncharacterized protein LOC116411112 [Xenopus tropicalis]
MESVSPGQVRPGRAISSRETQALGPTLEGQRITRSGGKGQEEKAAAGVPGKAVKGPKTASERGIPAAMLEERKEAGNGGGKAKQREVPVCVQPECGKGEGRKVTEICEKLLKVKQHASKAESKKPDSKCDTNAEQLGESSGNSDTGKHQPPKAKSHKSHSKTAPTVPQTMFISHAEPSKDGGLSDTCLCVTGSTDTPGATDMQPEARGQSECWLPGVSEAAATGGHLTSPKLTGIHVGTPSRNGASNESSAQAAKPVGGHLASPSLGIGHARDRGAMSVSDKNGLKGKCTDVNKNVPLDESGNIDTNQLVKLIKLAQEQEEKKKKLKLDLKQAFSAYSLAKVEHQDFYLCKVDEINADLRELENQISIVQGKIGPMSEVFSNRKRFEKQQRRPRHTYRSAHPISTSSSTSGNESDAGRGGRLTARKTIVAQIHAPNFVFSAHEISTVEDKMQKKVRAAFRQEEEFVYSHEDFPSLPTTSQHPSPLEETTVDQDGTPASGQHAPKVPNQGHGQSSDMELTEPVAQCHKGGRESANGAVTDVAHEIECDVSEEENVCAAETVARESEEGNEVAVRCIESVLEDSSTDVPDTSLVPLSNVSSVLSSNPDPPVNVSSVLSPNPDPPVNVSSVSLSNPDPPVNVSSSSNSAFPCNSGSATVSKAVLGQKSGVRTTNSKVAPPPPVNAWTRPVNRVRVPGVENNIIGSVFKQKNLVRLRWTGEKELMPTRDEIAKEMLLKQTTLTPSGVRAYIKFSELEYDLVFKTSQGLEHFWQDYDNFKNVGLWKNFRVIPITKPETRKVTVLFKNDRVPPEDILLWLKRHCKVLTPLRMDIDNNGYWSGGWCANVELIVRHNVPHHLPNSLYIGSERGIVFYPGQPRACFKCGSYRHRARDCAVVRCSLCGGEGHTSKQCEDVKCNLCGHFGHPHRACPEALHNIMRDCPQLEEEMAEDLLEELQEELHSDLPLAQPSSVSLLGSLEQDPEIAAPLKSSSFSQAVSNESNPITDVPVSQPLFKQPLPQRQKPQPSVPRRSNPSVPIAQNRVKASPSPEEWINVKGKKEKEKVITQPHPSKCVPSMTIRLENKFDVLSESKTWGEAMEEAEELERIGREEEKEKLEAKGRGKTRGEGSTKSDLEMVTDNSVAEGLDSNSDSGQVSEMETERQQVSSPPILEKKGEGGTCWGKQDDSDELISLGDDDPIPSGTQVKRFGDLEGDTSQEDKKRRYKN